MTGTSSRRAEAIGNVEFARQWMRFVHERCERGRGIKPRWATNGIDFLLIASSAHVTHYLEDKDFFKFKDQVSDIIDLQSRECLHLYIFSWKIATITSLVSQAVRESRRRI